MKQKKDDKIMKYHYEEIVLILLICASDLSGYGDEDLIDFAEDIEGRIDVLLEPNFLLKLNKYFNADLDVFEEFSELRNLVMRLYSSQWHRKLKEESDELFKIKILAKDILKKLDIAYVAPKTYIENNLNINW